MTPVPYHAVSNAVSLAEMIEVGHRRNFPHWRSHGKKSQIQSEKKCLLHTFNAGETENNTIVYRVTKLWTLPQLDL